MTWREQLIFLSLLCVLQEVADNQIDSGDLMECLIQNKHQKEMNEKCAIGVTHFQLVSSAFLCYQWKLAVCVEGVDRNQLIMKPFPFLRLISNCIEVAFVSSDNCTCMPGRKWSLLEMVYPQALLQPGIRQAGSQLLHSPCFHVDKLWPGASADCVIQQASFQAACTFFFFFQVTNISNFFSLLQVQMKDFRFSYKFKMACKEDVLKLCPNIKKKQVVLN